MSKPGDGRRVAKAEKEVQQAIAQFILKDLRSSLKGIVTVSKVIMPADLRSAKVYVSVLGEDKDSHKNIEVLKGNAHGIQNFIGRQLRMKYCPKLHFYLDDTTEQVLKIDRILYQLNQEAAKKKGDS